MTGLSDGTCDSVVRFLCRSNEAVRTELSGPDCDLTHSPLSERVCGESESERASEPFLRWAAVLDYVSSHFASVAKA